MSDIFEKSQERLLPVQVKKKLSTYPTQRNLNQLVVVVHCPINALAQKEWKWWVWFLFALRYSDWKRRLTSRDSNLGSVLSVFLF